MDGLVEDGFVILGGRRARQGRGGGRLSGWLP
jgi:hypothetical protein